MYHPQLGRFLQRDPIGYLDGMNAYAAYHVSRNGFDPFGLNVEQTDSECNEKNQCICKNIEIVILDNVFTVYDVDQVLRTPSETVVDRLGARIQTTFTVEGDITKCKYYQDESGPGERLQAHLRWKYVREDGEGSKFSETNDGGDQRIVERNGYSNWDQENGTVTYTDPMGKDYKVPNRSRTNLVVQVRLHATLRCISSNGAKLEKDFEWGGKEGVEGTTKQNEDGTFTTSGSDPTPNVGDLREIPAK